MKIKTDILVLSTAVAVSSTAVSFYTYKHCKPQETPTKVIQETKVNEFYEKAIEINKRNRELIVYETSPTKYSATYSEGEILPLEVKFDCKYSYSVTIDLSKSTVYTIGNQVFIVVNLRDVTLHDIQIDSPNLTTQNHPISTALRGKSVASLNTQALSLSYESINNLIQQQLESNTSAIESNVRNKVQSLYNQIPNVTIKIEGDIQW